MQTSAPQMTFYAKEQTNFTVAPVDCVLVMSASTVLYCICKMCVLGIFKHIKNILSLN